MHLEDTEPPPGAGLAVVDAANVVGARPDGWWRDRAGAARRLVEALRSAPADVLGSDVAVLVVLEGRARGGVPADDRGRLGVVHAAGSGDDAIVDLVAEARTDDPPRPVTVVTSDRGLRERVEALGAQTRGSRWLWDRLDSAGATGV